VKQTLTLALPFCAQIKRVVIALVAVLPAALLAETNSWSLLSPDGHCAISVSLNTNGGLSYHVSREGKVVVLPSPLGIRRDDQPFDSALTLQSAGAVEQRREVYELFAGVTPRVDHALNHRSIVFCNINRAQMTLDLAASDEGVAFRYRFGEAAPEARVVQAELTGFKISPEARGWMQPYHAAGPYTPYSMFPRPRPGCC